uniref:RING-type domain-containing protein n=1 Tax=Myripristis murdjan TaxID=586833 RepID=A0A667ZSV6_9TELE
MAQRGIQPDSAKFCCSICLDLLKDPVIIPCGHSYCMSCIKDWWDGEEHMEIYSCPQCRQTFTPRPVLVKNTMLADVVEEMKKMGLQAAPPDLCYAGPGDVACDFCTGRKVKALKSCLVCLASYCEHHLQPHYEIAQLKKHKLVEATVKLQENICANHDEVMKIFCCTDQQCICYLCSMDEHKGHHKVSAAAERKERQKELGVSRQKIQQRIQDREKEVKVLQQEVEEINHSQQIRSQQKEEVSRAEEVHTRENQLNPSSHEAVVQSTWFFSSVHICCGIFFFFLFVSLHEPQTYGKLLWQNSWQYVEVFPITLKL